MIMLDVAALPEVFRGFQFLPAILAAIEYATRIV
jgi:hypothetical protein